MKTYKVVLVGYGPRGKIWSKILKKNKNVKLVAICDVNLKTKNKDSKKIPFYLKIENAIFENNPDFIVLSTPPASRMKDLKVCAKYKLPVLVEKPLAVNINEAKKLVRFMNRNKLLMMVGLNFRYLPSTIEKIKLIKLKKVGKPNFARFVYERWRDGKLMRLNKYPLLMDQPMLWEQSIHHFDLIRYVYNSEIKSVYATTSNPPWSMYKDDTNVNAILELKNKIIINYVGNWQSNSKSLNFEWRTDCENGIIIQKKQFEDYLQTINRQIKDIENLVNEFSHFARMPRPVFKKIDLNSKKILIFILISVVIIFFSYRGIARYYLEFYFLICYVIFQNFDKVKYSKFFKLILHLQVAIMVLALLYSVSTLTPGIMNKNYWNKVMSSKTNGFILSKKINKIIQSHHPGTDKNILLSEIRYGSLFSKNFISDQYNRFQSPDLYSDDNNYTIKDVKSDRKIDFILFRQNSFNIEYFNKNYKNKKIKKVEKPENFIENKKDINLEKC